MLKVQTKKKSILQKDLKKIKVNPSQPTKPVIQVIKLELTPWKMKKKRSKIFCKQISSDEIGKKKCNKKRILNKINIYKKNRDRIQYENKLKSNARDEIENKNLKQLKDKKNQMSETKFDIKVKLNEIVKEEIEEKTINYAK